MVGNARVACIRKASLALLSLVLVIIAAVQRSGTWGEEATSPVTIETFLKLIKVLTRC